MIKKLLTMIVLGCMAMPMTAENITVNGTTRNYIVYVPKNLGENRPLLISCHGMNQDANYQKGMLKIETVADTAKFVTVFPNGIDKGWDISGDRDINFVKAIIDKMVDQYKINRNCVYLSGFSMGGMFTYHAMNKIPDVIAAFAPISGYSLGGTTANANVRPIPIIHTHGTTDDVVNFSGVQGALNAWINHNHCPTQAKVETRYRGAAHITRRTWGPGDNGVEVVLMEMANKGHWISNDNGVLTGDEIWKFCKRFSLEMKNPVVRITAPTKVPNYVTIGGQSAVPAITLKATASDPDGQVVKVAFYDNQQLLEEQTEAPYSYVVKNLEKGKHELRVVATDDEGRTGSASVSVNVEEPTTSYVFSKVFENVEGGVPDGWTTYDGADTRIGYQSGFSQGPRVFHFTGSTRDFDWGLYTRNTTGNAKNGYARFGAKESTTALTLYPGRYQLYYKVCNWNCADFSPVTINIENNNGKIFATETFTPTSNVGNTASNSFSGTVQRNFKFDITVKARYQVSFYTADAAWADLVVGQSYIRRLGDLTAIDAVTSQTPVAVRYFTTAGVPVEQPVGGVYIRQTVMQDGSKQSCKVIF